MKSFLRSFILATLGAFSFSCAVAFFYDPARIAPGGITGFAVIISNLFPKVTTGSLIFVFNIPLLIFAWLRFGKKFVALTVYTTIASSLIVDLIEPFSLKLQPLSDDLIVVVLCGALLDAVGVGLVFHAGGSTGGVDIVIKFLRQKYRHIRTGSMSLVINIIVVIASFAAFGEFELAAYSAIAITTASFILDKILYGGDSAKLIFIISDMHTEITEKILSSVHVGVTLLSGEGAYTKKKKQVLLCAAKKHTFPKIREIVKETDGDAFMIISSATEIFGEGYKDQYTDEM